MNTSSTKEPSLLQFNGVSWTVRYLGEKVILLQGSEGIDINQVHASTHLIERALKNELNDIVPAYDSIALFSQLTISELASKLESVQGNKGNQVEKSDELIIPVCYELGSDLDELSDKIGLSKREIIDIHSSGSYQSLFIGFTPGFIYAGGLNPRLSCPRKSTPRTLVPAGSVGIGGAQTGIYSLDSPGGWHIIGRTPMRLFDIDEHPPMRVEIGTQFRFKRITKEEFELWED